MHKRYLLSLIQLYGRQPKELVKDFEEKYFLKIPINQLIDYLNNQLQI